MASPASNLVLIGMPGAGKSTLGVVLAKETSRDFIDTDLLIQNSTGCSLQQIVDEQGYHRLRELEEQVLLGIDADNSVIATGGSAVYSSNAMNHLKASGLVLYLDVDLAEIKRRIGDYSDRGIAMQPDQPLEDLFEERAQLYSSYADIQLDCSTDSLAQTCKKIQSHLDSL